MFGDHIISYVNFAVYEMVGSSSFKYGRDRDTFYLQWDPFKAQTQRIDAGWCQRQKSAPKWGLTLGKRYENRPRTLPNNSLKYVWNVFYIY